MNEIFQGLLEGTCVIIYLDDILIATDGDIEKHRQIVNQVLEILEKNDLFLKPEKCEFEKDKIEYLGVMVSNGQVTMDPIKVEGILEWPTPKSVKETQSFLGFCNFYRRFIKDFSKIAQPLFQLTRKGTIWNWNTPQEEAFKSLKAQFTTAPMLVSPDTTKRFCIECDASDFATGAILTQLEDDQTWHPVAYLSKSLTETERNYDIHDKELLAIIRALETWRHYLEGCKYQVEIWTDHRNLEYFKKAQNLSRRQARWAQFLTRFDFTLEHKPGKGNKADGLSRRADHKEGVEFDNHGQTLLPEQLFAKNTSIFASSNGNKTLERRIRIKTTRIINPETLDIGINTGLKEKIKKHKELDDIVLQSLETIKQSGPRSMRLGLQEWNLEDGLILFRGKVYVPRNQELRREIVKNHHDTIIMGHPGRDKTTALVQENYWWPGMRHFITNYVKGCAICQETKNITHPTREPIHPTEIPNRPFETITMDFITDLPISDGFDSILVVTDRHTKTVIFEPCLKTINADKTADLLLKKVFRRYGIPSKIICDRGPQFASQVMRTILQGLGIQLALSSAYHPQTDGATERVNQELEQYLRAYCSRRQNIWSQLLPYAEISHNIRPHSATGKSPFELMHGYSPSWGMQITTNPEIPTADQRLKELQELRDEATAALQMAADVMKRSNQGLKTPDFQIGQQVLDGKNLRMLSTSGSHKLQNKRYGPFPIVDVIGYGTYRLQLPPSWKIHPVFHASLLLPYHKTEEHGPNFIRPPPDIINDEEEYEVEAILDSKINKTYRKEDQLRYFVKWKGYPDSENEWISSRNLENAPLLVEQFHKENPSRPKVAPIRAKTLRDAPQSVRLRILNTLYPNTTTLQKRSKKGRYSILEKYKRER